MARILLVEDNEMNRDMISRKLRRQGYEMLLAADGAEGIDKAMEEAPDLVLMDMALPVLDGYAATRLLKGTAETRDIPVIGLSAHAMAGDADKALAAGCDDYDTKPVEWDRLLSKIREALEKRITAGDPGPEATAELGPEDAFGLQAGRWPGRWPGRARPRRVLVIDGSPVRRELLARRLGELGLSYELAEDEGEAWEALRHTPFDAVLLDVTVAGAGAGEALKRLKSDPRQGEIPVLVTCPADALEAAVGCLELGADDCVAQPFHGEVLAVRLASCLERRELRQQKKTYERVIRGEQRHSEHLLRVLFPAPIVDELAATQKILPRRYPDVAVLLCGVADFASLCDVSDPLEVVGHLQAIVSAWEEIAERHRVLEVKTVGAALMGAAGLFTRAANPVLDGVRCAFEMKEAAAEVRPGWSLRIGIHVGPVVAGVVGRQRYRFDLWGSTVQTAARVKAEGAVDAVNLSATAWQRVAGSCTGRPLSPPSHGGDEAAAIYRVESVTSG